MKTQQAVRRLIFLLLSLVAAVGVAVPAVAVADDTDVYRNPTADVVLPPATIISIDLNALGLCDNVLTLPTSTLNSTLQSCVNERASLTLQTLLSPGGQTPLQFLTSLGPASLCTLATALGAQTPTIAAGLLGTLSCGTLATLINNPLLGATVLTSLTSQLASVVLNVLTPFLPTTIANLQTSAATIVAALNAVLPPLNKIAAPPLTVNSLNTLLNTILQSLINSQVAIIISHNNLGNASGNPVPYQPDGTSYPNGNRYACNFSDISSTSALSAGLRQNTGNCSNGAYFIVPFTTLVSTSTVNSVASLVTGPLSNLINPQTGLINLANLTVAMTNSLVAQLMGGTLATTPPYQGKEIYDEIFHYLNGDTVFNAPLNSYDGLFTVLPRATAIESGGKYVAPTLVCRTVNVLNLETSNSTYDNDSDGDINSTTYFPGLGLNPAGGFASPPTSTGFSALVSAAQTVGFPSTSPAAARFQINSFFVLQDNLSSVSALNNSGATLLTYSNAVGLFGLGQTIPNLLKPVLSVDASLASVVSVDRISLATRNVPSFLAEFHPTLGQKPAWPGNLKRIDLKQATSGTTTTLSYVDANGANAIDPTDGRLLATAKTFWSPAVDGRITTLGGAGANIPGYLLAGGGNPGRLNGVAGGRTLYYDTLAGNALVPSLGALNADSSGAAAVTDLTPDTGAQAETTANCGVAKSAAQVAQELLLFARGFDTGTSCAGSKGATNVVGRSWLVGAVMHSRPVAINYGAYNGASTTDPDIRVLYGSADGYLHMVKNGSQGSPSGVETWAFMPRETMGNLKVLRDNRFVTQLPYGVDGAPAVLFKSTSSTTTANTTGVPAAVYAYFGMRRGGTKVYALDISNPDSPKLMWRIGTDGLYSANAAPAGLVSGSAANFAELGMTFSTPSIGKIQFTGESSPRSVVVFGAGYNGGFDSTGARIGKDLNNSRNTSPVVSVDPRVGLDDQPASGTGRGNALYMVDAVTGQLLWKAAYSSSLSYNGSTLSFGHPLMADSIPSEVTLLDTDGDGISDRLYVGDTGGRVWRMDFPGGDRTKWTVSLLASIGRHGAGNSNSFADDRRFFLPPDYVPTRDTTGGANGHYLSTTNNYTFDAIIIGSGDREDPFNKVTNNVVYAFHDLDIISGKSLTDTGSSNGVISSESDQRLLTKYNVPDLSSACAGGGSGCSAAYYLDNGWQLALGSAGEKMASTPVTTNQQVAGTLGTVFFSTYVPPSQNSCTQAEGTGLVYAVALGNSRAIYAFNGQAISTRSVATKAPGLQGQLSALSTGGVGFNADSLTVTGPGTQPIYWRERRLDQ